LGLHASVEAPSAIAPLIDPNFHSCGSVPPHGEKELRHPEPGFYMVGMKSYGRAPTFLLATGYEQARSVVAALVGDWQAAAEVQLELPETGVCGVPAAVDANGLSIGGGCCGTPGKSSAEVAPASALISLDFSAINLELAPSRQPVSLEAASSCCGVDNCCTDAAPVAADSCCTPQEKLEVIALTQQTSAGS
jgi:hypothetical protein